MEVPFTTEQFFNIIIAYNQAAWPMQWVLNLMAVAALVLLFRRAPTSGQGIAAILALLWLWTGIAYHLVYFTTINPAAYLFAGFYLLAALLFFWTGVVRGRLQFAAGWSGWNMIGAVLIAYALLVYPLLSRFLGHGYPMMPTFGLPCPSTIFTIGMLCFLAPPFPRYVLLIPVLWTLVGTQAAFLFGVWQDMGLMVAGVIGIGLVFKRAKSSLSDRKVVA